MTFYRITVRYCTVALMLLLVVSVRGVQYLAARVNAPAVGKQAGDSVLVTPKSLGGSLRSRSKVPDHHRPVRGPACQYFAVGGHLLQEFSRDFHTQKGRNVSDW